MNPGITSTTSLKLKSIFRGREGRALFLLSPLDWALIETWKDAGVPLEAVLRGIDAAFEKWHARKKKLQNVNSLAYCAQAVFAEAQIMAGAAPSRADARKCEAPFSLERSGEVSERECGGLAEAGAVCGNCRFSGALAGEAEAALRKSGRVGATVKRAGRQDEGHGTPGADGAGDYLRRAGNWMRRCGRTGAR